MKSLILALMISMSALNLNQQSQQPSWVCDHKVIEEITPYTTEAFSDNSRLRNLTGRTLSIEEMRSVCAPDPCPPATAFSQEGFVNYVSDIAREVEIRRTRPGIFNQKEPIKLEFETYSRGEIDAMIAIVPNAQIGAVGGPRIFTQLSKKGVACGTWETYRKLPTKN